MRFASRCIAFAALVVALATPPMLHAQQSGGPQPALCFGSGSCSIPNSYVLTNDNAGALGVTLGLTASDRCSGSPQVCGATVTDDAANTFFAAPGATFAGQSHPSYASWNFDFEATGANVANYTYLLLYGIDPAYGGGTLGTWDLGIDLMDSENLGFSFLTTGVAGVVTPPSGWSAFDPTAHTQYDFVLEAIDGNDDVAASVGMCVNTEGASSICSAVTPEPATMSLMAMGLVGMGGATLRRRRSKKV